MVNINQLKGKIVERELSIGKLAVIIGVDKSTLYRKINGEGKGITVNEADAISKALELRPDEINSIFFNR